MQTITVHQAQTHLAEIIEKLTPGEEIVLLQDNQPVARLVGESPAKPFPIPGRCQGMLNIVAEDDEHLKDWAEYLP
jgi:antitoxin (DNA-binding transcriptional repressor) of toxin-antitoxin stability system